MEIILAEVHGAAKKPSPGNVKIGHNLFGGMIGVADGHRSGIEDRGIAWTLLGA